MATPIWLSGFEFGKPTVTATGTSFCSTASNATISSSVKRTGSYALRLYTSTSGVPCIEIPYPSASTATVARFYIRWAAWPSSTSDWVFKCNFVSGSGPGLKLDASHKLYSATSGSTGNTLDQALSLDIWYRIDIKVTCNANPTTVDFQVDGSAATQWTVAQAADTIDMCRLGTNSSVTVDHYFDDVFVSVTPADYPIGEGVVVAVRPNAEGTHANTNSYIKDASDNVINGTTYTAYPKLDDLPWPDTDDGDYLKQTSAAGSDYVEVQFSDPAVSGTIHGASATLLFNSAGTATNDGATKIYDADSQETVLFDGEMAIDGTTLGMKHKAITTPSGGWTTAQLNALKARLGYSTEATTPPRWHGLIIEVAASASGRTGTYRDTTMIGTW